MEAKTECEMIRRHIKNTLKRRNLTQLWLAEETGMNPRTLCQRLSGRSELKVSELCDIAKVLGIKFEIGE